MESKPMSGWSCYREAEVVARHGWLVKDLGIFTLPVVAGPTSCRGGGAWLLYRYADDATIQVGQGSARSALLF